MNVPYPQWLHILSWVYLSLCFFCGVIMIADELRRPQKMMIMNFVWPITALYGGPVALWCYFKSGPKMTKQHLQQMKQEVNAELNQEKHIGVLQIRAQSQMQDSEPTREQVTVATTHCGAGCTLGDIVSEWWIFGAGLIIAGGELRNSPLAGFHTCLEFWSCLPVLHDCADARAFVRQRGASGNASRYPVDRYVSDWDVSLGSAGVLRPVPRTASSSE
jgi:hypothetical protein